MRASVIGWSGAAVLALYFPLSASAPPAAMTDRPSDLAGQLQRGAVRDLATGKLLVATRNLPDPNFAETVVLLAEFTRQGAMGLIVNRRSEVTLARLLPGFENPNSRAAFVFFGGPVAAPGVLALLRSANARTDSRRIVDDVYLVNTQDVFKEMLSSGIGPNRFRVYVGYAGWGAGQLDRETAQGAWHVLDADGDVVFDSDPDSMWQRQIRLAESLSVQRLPAGDRNHGSSS